MALQMGKSTMMRLPEAVRQRSVGNPAVVQAMLVAPDTLYIVGVDVGTTNMIVQGRSGVCSVIDVTVAMDPGGLQAMLARGHAGRKAHPRAGRRRHAGADRHRQRRQRGRRAPWNWRRAYVRRPLRPCWRPTRTMRLTA